jgi:hypothetical protein
VRREGSRLFKVHGDHVSVTPCRKWPEGLVTAFNGWVDLLDRLTYYRDYPEYVVGGIYIPEAEHDAEIGPAEEAKKLAEDYPHVDQQRELSEYN